MVIFIKKKRGKKEKEKKRSHLEYKIYTGAATKEKGKTKKKKAISTRKTEINKI